MAAKPDKYDGVYFLPGDDESELVISYFDFKGDMEGGVPVEGSKIGDVWQVAFFKKDEEGNPVFDDHFEAILVDPATWIKNLAGSGVYGCAVKKTDKSSDWFDDYLRRTVGYVKVKQMIGTLRSILETK